MKELLTVREVCALFGLGVQTLHYYDRIGLFRPAWRDPATGYRKYSFDQIYQLASIRYLRKLGCSLEEIRSYLDSRNPDQTVRLLRERSKALQDQWSALMQIDGAIRRKLQFMAQKRAELQPDSMRVRWYPERRYIPIGGEEQLYMEDSFYFYPTIAFYEENLKYFGAYFDVSADGLGEETGIDPLMTAAIPAGRFLVGYHQGPYERVEERFAQMRAARPDLPLSRRVVNFNIIDQFVERDPARYITEIQIRVLEDGAEGE